MHLLYLDESGNHSDARWFVLAGLSVPERQTHWIEQSLNTIAEQFDHEQPLNVELHGNPMHKGSGRWRKVDRKRRESAIKEALNAGVFTRMHFGIRLFAAVIDRDKLQSNESPIDIAFEQVASRFDHLLTRLNQRVGRTPERGLILCDKASNELSIQAVARKFKYEGHQWGRTRNYAEVPVFLDSENSRLIQLADLVAYAIYQHYAQGNSTYFDTIRTCFDSESGRVHGLYEHP
jgi:Protein of unknown function (DUF3800)